MAIYEKESSRFVFPDGSAVYRDAAGIITLKSSNSAIPHIYVPTTLDSELAMATDAFFAGNKEYFKGDPGQKIIPIEEFENNFLEPFIQTIVSHGV